MANTVSGRSEVLLALMGLNPSDIRRTRDELFPDLMDTWADGTTGANTLHAQYATTLTITQAVGNATLALHLACLALGVGPGTRVWTTPISFVASASRLLRANLSPGNRC